MQSRSIGGFVMLFMLIFGAAGCGPRNVHPTAVASMEAFISEANAQAVTPPSKDGSLWSTQGTYANLFRDFKARRVNDVVTILVSESMQATSAADTNNSRDTAAQLSYSALFGAEKMIKELPNVLNGKSTSSFKGAGSTSRETMLNTTVTARVKEVMPNGYLVIEGIRELKLNNENQTICITGIVRPEDISARNIVPSGAIAQMEVRVAGKGAVSQPIKPGWLYRILLGILPF